MSSWQRSHSRRRLRRHSAEAAEGGGEAGPEGYITGDVYQPPPQHDLTRPGDSGGSPWPLPKGGGVVRLETPGQNMPGEGARGGGGVWADQ